MATLGQGSLGYSPRVKPSSGGGSVSGANNGLSLSGTDAQLGQDVGAVGDPAALLNDREIPLDGFQLRLKGLLLDVLFDDANQLFQIADALSNPYLFVDPQNTTFWLGDINGIINNSYFYLDNIGFEITADGRSLASVDLGADRWSFGDVGISELRLDSTPGTEEARIVCENGFSIESNSNFLLRTINALIDGAGANAGTLTNSPIAGDPTKWIAIDDAGVTRYIPAW